MPTNDGGVTGACGTLVPQATTACCMSCSKGGQTCQANGCYGGWWCDTAACHCSRPPTTCGGSGNTGGGGVDGGGFVGPPPTGTVGPNGGTVSRLYFAVVGDTRPANPDDTANYPTQIITKIYADIEAMSPRPQFVLTTGDYMFASPSGNQAQAQIALYTQAAQQFTGGPIFADMGNHECTGATASNCATMMTSNYQAYLNALVKPLGKTQPYYTVDFNDTNGAWTAKLIIVACNAWDQTQSSWLQGELAKQTTHTFISRHEPTGTTAGPCVSDMDNLLRQSTYDLLIVGHSHTFAHYNANEVIIGNGGAPISGGTPYGYATIEQLVGGGFLVTQYDYSTAVPLSSFTVP
jgi:hypothetical protein